MQRYSLVSIIGNALRGNTRWRPLWRSPEPQKRYDVVVIGGGGHGLATAYYLAKEHGIRRVAVLEKSWIGGGNSGRNTQVLRSNYFHPAGSSFYDYSLRLYEKLARELNFNIMLSQRGFVTIAHSQHELEIARRWMNAIAMNRIDVRELTAAQLHRRVPALQRGGRYPIVGGYIQPRAGIARHDSVVWAYARAADALGVDVVQGCEVERIECGNARVHAVRTSRGVIEAERVVLAAAGHSVQLAQQIGLRLPIRTMALQAMVGEPVQPVLDQVVASTGIHAYVSQSDRGEIVIGGGADVYNSYMQRGSLHHLRATVCAMLQLFPSFGRLRLMRQWAGTVDITPDASPILGMTPVHGLYISCGWGTGGYKAIPAGGSTMAYTVAHDRAHPLIRPFALERFASAALVDENGAAGVAH